MAGTRTDGPIEDCIRCPVGAAAGVAHGYRCPLANRARPAGSTVYLQGQDADRVWFVKSGAVLLCRGADDPGEEPAPRAVRRPGDFVGIECLTRKDYADTARVAVDAVLCGAERDAFERWLNSSPGAARAVLGAVLTAEDDHTTPPPVRGKPGATQRTAAWVLEASKRGETSALRRREVAALLGMLPETFSRALASLQRRGAVALTRRQIRVLDRQALAAAATGRA